MANLIANPSFEVDSNADGLADNWAVQKNVSGTPTTSRVAGLFGSWAQRIAYTGSSDTAKYFALLADLTAVGTAAPGHLSGRIWARIAYSGITNVQVLAYANNAAGTVLTTNATVFNLPPQDVWFPISTYINAPADTSRTRLLIQVNGIDTGDTATLDVDGVYLSPDASFDYYGKYPVIGGSL